MHIQTSNSVSLITLPLRSTLNRVKDDVDLKPEKLFVEFGRAGIQPTGPMQFVYKGITADRDAEFDLNISLPVSVQDAQNYKGDYPVVRLNPFQFVEIVMHGDINKIDINAYEPLIKQITGAGLTMTGIVREVYQNYVDMTSEDNETRVQIGVQG